MGLYVLENPEEFEQRIFQKLENLESSIRADIKKELYPASEEYLTREDVAKLLKVTTATVDNWTSKRKLRKYGICGRRALYKRSEVESSLTLIE